MAGNKMSKTKSKEVSKLKTTQQDENDEEIDFSVLRKPIMTSTTGFAHAKKIFDLATEELKQLMVNECDVLYECKVCRNIFRSLPNFISHKRVYCKEKFDQRSHGHFMAAASLSTQIKKIQNLEKNYQESLTNGKAEKADSDEDRIPMTKDLTAVIEKLTKAKGVSNKNDGVMLKLQKIPSSSAAVFQNVNLGDDDESSNNSMRSQVLELDNILSQDKAVLQKDGKFTVESSKDGDENVIHISDDDDDQAKLRCKICSQQFSTAKTLRFHMKYKHVAARLVYPCPDCLDIFSNSWGVYRHLFKVHRKTAAQIRRLRESIQAKAFKMDNPPAYYERRKNNNKPVAAKLTEEERLDQENQAWMENMESDSGGARCGGCGRGYERRAALLAHTASCGARSRKLAARSQRRIEIQLRRDYNKGEAAAPAAAASEIQQRREYNINKGADTCAPQTARKDDAVSEPTTDENKLGEDENAQCSFNKDTTEDKPLEEAKMFIPEEEANSNSASKGSTTPTESPEKTEDIINEMMPKELADKPKIKLLFTMQAEKLGNNLKTLKQLMKTRSDADLQNYACNKCETKFKGMFELMDHMADHYKWVRYSCKLCNYKNYYFEKLSEHVKLVHKLKGDTDFYYSTVKAVDGNEALELVESEVGDEGCESRTSDDSASGGGRRKRKLLQGRGRIVKRKEAADKEETESTKSNDMTMDVMQVIFGQQDQRKDIIEEDVEISRKQVDITAPYRRPVRNRAKRKNEDFEYDLSNLLKMEAQGYRESQSQTPPAPKVATALTTNKISRKKSLPDANSPQHNEVLSRSFAGALLTMAKKSVELSAAHIKPFDMSIFTSPPSVERTTTFARPLMPKFASRAEKLSPKRLAPKEEKLEESSELEILNVGAKTIKNEPIEKEKGVESPKQAQTKKHTETAEPEQADGKDGKEDYIPAMVPVKFHRESMEVMKNPIINKSLTDFSKAGMKTKILVIKPINKIYENVQRLQFQRIKLKDPSKTGEESKSDQVRLVKVPPVVVQKTDEADENVDKSNKNIESNKTSENHVMDKSDVNSDCNGVAHEETVINNKDSTNSEMDIDEALDSNQVIEVETTS